MSDHPEGVNLEDGYFSEKFIDAVYGFCYKRLYDSENARDLAQEILLEALSALREKKPIHSFYPWFWQMAQNKTCALLRQKKSAGLAIPLDVCGGSLPADCGETLTEGIEFSEELSRLNTAIAKSSAIHREIVILFYLRQMSIAQIADSLGVPQGTVKRRLYDAKDEIRKGMSSMSNIGKASYAPAELNLWGGFMIVRHWNFISDLMIKQIFIVCAKEPKTRSEIAEAIGVAPVYFEEKLSYLLQNKFLKEVGNGRFLTDFLIFPAQAHADFHYLLSRVYSDIGKEITEIIENTKDEIRKLDFYGSNFPYDYLMWLFYVYACDQLSNLMLDDYQKRWEGKIAENNGKDYRVAGCVTFPEETIHSENQHCLGWSNLHQSFATADYKWIQYANLYEHEPFRHRDEWVTDKNIATLIKIYDNPETRLTPVEEEQAAAFVENGLVRKRDGGLFLAMPVMKYEVKMAIEMIFRKALTGLAAKYQSKVSELGEKCLLPHVRKDLLEEYVHWGMQGAFFPIGYVLHYAIYEEKTLAIPQDYQKSAAGLCLYYNK